MIGFEPVTLSWKGAEYTVPADGQLLLIAKIEDALTGGRGGQAITVLMASGGPSYVRLSQAYGAALRHAGADVTDEEIYLSIMSDMAEAKADVAAKVQGAIMGLLAIIAPPVALAISQGSDKKKPSKKKTSAAR